MAVSKDGRIQIAYFREDRATGIEMNANGQLSPGITDLHALQGTNSVPIVSPFLTIFAQKGGKTSQTMWMRQWWIRRGQ